MTSTCLYADEATRKSADKRPSMLWVPPSRKGARHARRGEEGRSGERSLEGKDEVASAHAATWRGRRRRPYSLVWASATAEVKRPPRERKDDDNG
jgi:hypothetical protein